MLLHPIGGQRREPGPALLRRGGALRLLPGRDAAPPGFLEERPLRPAARLRHLRRVRRGGLPLPRPVHLRPGRPGRVGLPVADGLERHESGYGPHRFGPVWYVHLTLVLPLWTTLDA